MGTDESFAFGLRLAPDRVPFYCSMAFSVIQSLSGEDYPFTSEDFPMWREAGGVINLYEEWLSVTNPFQFNF